MSLCDATSKFGHVCTLEKYHAGKHEAWEGEPGDANARCIASWPILNHRWNRPWWRIFFTFDRRCLRCGVYLTRKPRGPRMGMVYELRYPDGSKLTHSTRAMPDCSGKR